MSSRDHRAAVERRLALLRTELEPPEPDVGRDDDAWWAGHTRVAGLTDRASTARDSLRDSSPESPSVPTPGRHAARRRIPLLPEQLRGRVELGPWHLAVVSLLLAVALAGTAWWIARGRPSEPVPVAASAASPLTSVASSLASVAPSPSAATSVTVDVTGRVVRPGVQVLPAGSRVVDAIAAAGGPRRGVNLSSLNQAQVLADGVQIVVGGAPPSSAGSAGAAAVPPAGPAGAPVNLNTASADELDALPDVGPVTAQAIVAYRQQHGAFSSVSQLLEIQGIGEKTLADIAPHATV